MIMDNPLVTVVTGAVSNTAPYSILTFGGGNAVSDTNPHRIETLVMPSVPRLLKITQNP